jgi:hypothetical protein
MPNQDDIAAQQALLQMHRQTLDVLLKQQAQFGEAYAPPAIVNGIRSARDSIAQIKQSRRDWGAPAEDLPNDAPHLSTATDPAFRTASGVSPTGGDTIGARSETKRQRSADRLRGIRCVDARPGERKPVVRIVRVRDLVRRLHDHLRERNVGDAQQLRRLEFLLDKPRQSGQNIRPWER